MSLSSSTSSAKILKSCIQKSPSGENAGLSSGDSNLTAMEQHHGEGLGLLLSVMVLKDLTRVTQANSSKTFRKDSSRNA